MRTVWYDYIDLLRTFKYSNKRDYVLDYSHGGKINGIAIYKIYNINNTLFSAHLIFHTVIFSDNSTRMNLPYNIVFVEII